MTEKTTEHAIGYNRTGRRTDADTCSSAHERETMEVLPEAHGHSSKQREPPENLQRRTMENGGGEASGLRSDNTSSSTTRDPFLYMSRSFYSSKKGAVSSLNS